MFSKKTSFLVVLIVVTSGLARANEVQFHICAAGQNLGDAYYRAKYFNGEIGPDQTAEIAANLANASAHIGAAESGVQQPFATSPARRQSIAQLQRKFANYADNARGRSPAAKMSMIQGFYTHYLSALAIAYVSSRPDAFRPTTTCDSAMLEANWHLGRAGTAAAVQFDVARGDQQGANQSAHAAIRKGLSVSVDGTSRTPQVACMFGTREDWSIVPPLRANEPHPTYVALLPRVLEVCRRAGVSDRQSLTPPRLHGECYAENRNIDLVGLRGRVLNGAMIPNDPAMTVQKCVSFCRSKEFAFAGLQFGRWCFCGKTPGYSRASNCNMACSGDSGQICGGAYANSVFSTR
jgi:hypothetical protein